MTASVYTARRRRARRDDPAFGPLCSCGSRKARQAWTCQACHSAARGYRLVPLGEQRSRWEHARSGAPIRRQVGDEELSAIRRRLELEHARRSAVGELAELADEQARDERYGGRVLAPWVLSLDAADAIGRTLLDRLAAA